MYKHKVPGPGNNLQLLFEKFTLTSEQLCDDARKDHACVLEELIDHLNYTNI